MDEEPQEDQFESIGNFSPGEVRKLFAALAQSRIEFRADFDDGVGKAGHYGGFGQQAQIHVRVDPARIEEVQQIQTELFGDRLPNYDSSFFEKEPPVDAQTEEGDSNDR